MTATGRPSTSPTPGDDAVGAQAVLVPVRQQRLLGEDPSSRSSDECARGRAACPARRTSRDGAPARRPVRARSPRGGVPDRSSDGPQQVDLRVRDGLGPGPVVEAQTGLLPVPARGDHLAQQRRRREARVAVLLVHALRGARERLEPDEVVERQRAHRVPGAEPEAGVDRLDRADALLERADRVEHERDEDPVDEEARAVAGLDRQLADARDVLRAGRHGLVGGRDRPHDLDEPHHLDGVEEVQPDDAVGALASPRPAR